MKTLDDFAMRYEAIIKKCFNCERCENGADASVFRKLMESFLLAYQTDKNYPQYKKYWEDYTNNAKEVKTFLSEALSQKRENELVNALNSDETNSLMYIVYMIGRISEKLGMCTI